MYCIPNKVDFYITNICNLTCNNCNRFNNHDFRGWQSWSDYKSDYQRWGQLTELKAVTIMGGEPFLNPTLGNWISGINSIFGIEVQVLTNGTRFRQSKHLYEKFLYWSDKNKCRNHIGVSLHNADQADRLHADILDFLHGPVDVYPKGHSQNKWNSDWLFVDANQVLVNVYVVDHFATASLIKFYKIKNPSNKVDSQQQPRTQGFRLHNNDPWVAHSNCAFAQFKSYHFIRGRLYKCGPVALMPDFDQQHGLDLSDSDRALLNSYQSLGVDNFEDYHKEFFENLDNPIPQCKFCPSHAEIKFIAPVRKGKTSNDIL